MSETFPISSGCHTNDPSAGAVRLNRDVLSLIFNMNADIFSYWGALKTTRFSSQVCSDWRSVILDSSSLWGKLMDIDALPMSRDEWRNEVLRRSGDSPLFITGAYSFRKPLSNSKLTPRQQFFFLLLTVHWSRIERLSITMNTEIANPPLWKAVYTPAPLLRVFEIKFSGRLEKNFNPLPLRRSLRLFANHAPLLHTFEATRTKYHLPAAWLSNLRSLTVGRAFSFPETLDILRLTPNLETFDLDWSKKLEQDTSVQAGDIASASLPYLNAIRLRGGLIECVTFLKCIVDMRPFSSFEAYLNDVPFGDYDDFTGSAETLSRVARDHCILHRPTAVFVGMYKARFLCKGNATNSLIQIDLSFASYPPRWSLVREKWQHPMDLLLVEFTMATFKSVLELDLVFMPYSVKDCSAALVSFFNSFSSVEVLHLTGLTGADTIWNLLSLFIETNETLFPFLKVVKIMRLGTLGGSIHEFICARRDAGYPIPILDLTECHRESEPRIFIDALDDIDGLKILWRRPDVEGILEHVCGTGSQQSITETGGKH